MKQVYKIEMYDAGVILHNTILSEGLEYVGWDFGGEAEGYEFTLFGLNLLQEIGALNDEKYRQLEERSDLIFAHKSLYREVWCASVEAEELADGTLKIHAIANRSHVDFKGDPEGWGVSVTYKGNYTVFWAEQEGRS